MSLTTTSALSPQDRLAVHAVVAAAERADDTAPLSEQALRAVDDEAIHFLATDSAGQLAGYANVLTPPGGGPGSAEVVVLPSARNRGVGSELVAAAITPGLTVWAHGDLPAAAAVASKLGLARVRELLQLRRPLAELPGRTALAGITIRTYRASDDAALLAVNNAAFSWHPEQSGWTQREIDERTAADWFDPAGLFLAIDDKTGAVLGFHWTKVHPATDTEPELGEVYIVAVDPGAQGRRVGAELTLAGLHYLRDRGLEAVLLYVEGDNGAALKTYRRLGFVAHTIDIAYG